MSKKMGLGQGVGLLFGQEKDKYFECEISKIIPNKHQPRTLFDQAELEELSQSIKENGIIQPLIVTSCPDENTYNLIAGERRLRASKLAGLTHVPVVVIDDIEDKSHLELALVENVQRTDLNPIEEADAYRRLIEKFGYTQEEIAQKVGKQRATITNLLRLLKLPDYIQQDVINKTLSEGHARSLLRLTDNTTLLQEVRDNIVRSNLSVRETEQLIKKFASRPQSSQKPSDESRKTQSGLPQSYVNSMITQLINHLNTKVVLLQNGSRGKIEIEYYSSDDFERLICLLLKE